MCKKEWNCIWSSVIFNLISSKSILASLLTELVWNSKCGSSEISDTKIFHILNGDFFIPIDIKSFEKCVDVLFLQFSIRIEHSISVVKHGQSLKVIIMVTLTVSIDPLLSLS